jgi:malate dehydrogenase (oxaloacetate-decarboxylating)(NADP+)
VNNDRNHFAACMVALGDADAMVTGVTRNYSVALEDVRRVIDAKPGHRVIGVSMVLSRGRTVLIADTAVTNCRPPRNSPTSRSKPPASPAASRLRAARRHARLLDLRPSAGRTHGACARRRCASSTRRVDFEYDGEMAADVALNRELMPRLYPFCRLTGPANVLVMPAFHSASISTKMLQELGGATVIGPLLVGLDRSVQIVPLSAKDSRHREHGGDRRLFAACDHGNVHVLTQRLDSGIEIARFVEAFQVRLVRKDQIDRLVADELEEFLAVAIDAEGVRKRERHCAACRHARSSRP